MLQCKHSSGKRACFDQSQRRSSNDLAYLVALHGAFLLDRTAIQVPSIQRLDALEKRQAYDRWPMLMSSKSGL